MNSRILHVLAAFLLLCGVGAVLSSDCKSAPPVTPPKLPASVEPGKPWHFAVSGDSRNCGDVVMPAIAAGVVHDQATFYWHLGDLRTIYDFDEDMKKINESLTIIDYEKKVWDDFIEHQITPFGEIPFYLGIGNHETIPPKTREEFVIHFADWLDTPALQRQRLRDNWKDHQLKPYYHWMQDGVDFINMDNASPEQFDSDQMEWFRSVVKNDADDNSVRTVVVGMHAALPNSISRDHSMSQWAQGELSGREVYVTLRDLQDTKHKNVYILASHSHYFMDGIFNTPYWQTLGSVLPGWIIGTAGAVRYRLPQGAPKTAQTDVYGYLLATVNPQGQPTGAIDLQFKQIQRKDVPKKVVDRYTSAFVDWCFTNNKKNDETGTASSTETEH